MLIIDQDIKANFVVIITRIVKSAESMVLWQKKADRE